MHAKKRTIANTPYEKALNENARGSAGLTGDFRPRLRGGDENGRRGAAPWDRGRRHSCGRSDHRDFGIFPLTSGSRHCCTVALAPRTRTIQVAAMLRRTALAAAVNLIAGTAALTNSAKANMDPAAFSNNLGYQLQTVNTIASPELRLGRFHALFREDFDITGLGRFILGRFWRVFNPLEQNEFLRLFEDYVVLTYSDRLSEYAGNGYRPRAPGSRLVPDGVIVTSEIVRDSEPFRPAVQPIRIDWRLTVRDGVYKISDVIIGVLSMAANGRSQLEGVVARNGGRAQAILAVMRQQIAAAQ
jgi:phospholipid transport system substrate-binding protein